MSIKSQKEIGPSIFIFDFIISVRGMLEELYLIE